MIRSLVAQTNADDGRITLLRNPEPETLHKQLRAGCQAWIDVVDATAEEIAWLAEFFTLNPAVVQDLQRHDRRPALLVYPSYLFLSLFEPHIRLSRVEGSEIHCLVTDTCFITLREADTKTVDNAYNRVANNPEAWRSGVTYFLYLTAQFVVDTYYPLLDSISNRLNGLEEQLLENGLDQSARKPIYRMKQQLINLRQMVAPQREVFSSVIGEQRLAESSSIRDLFRHLYERLLRVYDVIDSQRDLSSNVLDMLQNQEARRLVEAVNRLTIFSMIFLPLTFFTGLFELNFATTNDPVVLPVSGSVMFVLVIASMVISAGLMAWAFRQRGWL